MSLQKIVITGVNGFVGKHLVRELTDHGVKVVGVDRSSAADGSISDRLAGYFVADLAQTWPKIEDATAVIHLAGLAAAPWGSFLRRGRDQPWWRQCRWPRAQ